MLVVQKEKETGGRFDIYVALLDAIIWCVNILELNCYNSYTMFVQMRFKALL